MMTMSQVFHSRMKTIRKRGPQYLYCLVVVVPITLAYLVIRLIPMAYTVYISFFNWHLARPRKPFIGLQNYVSLLSDDLFLRAFKNTTLYAVVSVSITLILALALAIMLERPMRGKTDSLYKLLYFLPAIPTMVPVSVVWKWIYDPSYGLLNYFVGFFGIRPQGWLINPRLALWSIIAMSVWKNVGYYMVLFLVGLKDIPEQYYEAAEMDGCNKWQRFWAITVPLLRHMILFNLVMATMMAYNVFAPVYVMTTGEQGAAANPVRVLVFDMYENGFRYLKMGYASAEAVVLLVLVMALTIVQLRIFRINED
ncbi:MAG: sugar ABC transporter permease [Firmicutes bacterium]|nr:sugar ABC transporter permease [Bacillota bacterium]